MAVLLGVFVVPDGEDAARTLAQIEAADATGLDLVGCPACAAPAEVVERYVLESTDGPIEHATVLCSERHRYTVLVERLQTPRTPERRTGRWAPR